MGAGIKASLLRVLPADWSWSGKRVLDLGCGAGRLLRHLVVEARKTSVFCGCDIDEDSIAWLRQNLSPPFQVVRNEEFPPLPWEDSSFDLIYALSVFTHISDRWADWLLEVHRLLAPQGLALLTIASRGCYEEHAGEPWVEERVGMNTIAHGNPWSTGGPLVLHSPWWIRAHWGRLFEVLELREEGFGGAVEGPGDQGVVLLRPKATRVSREELLRIDHAEPREVLAIQHNLDQLKRETIQLRGQLMAMAAAQNDFRAARDAAETERDRLVHRLDGAEAERDYMRNSVSWRSTALLRSVRALVRCGQGS